MPHKRKINTPEAPKRSSRKVSHLKWPLSRGKSARKDQSAKAARG